MRRQAALALIAFFLTTSLLAQDPAVGAAPNSPMAGHAHAMGPGMSGGSCGDMCAGMMARMDSADSQLAALADAMNKAKGDKQKLQAMTALLNAMVQQRLQMQSAMKMMHQHMEHMMNGGMGGMGGMAGCAEGAGGCAAPPAPPAPPAHSKHE